jgi:micrococcal nuclease
MFEYHATLVRIIDGDTIEVDIDLGFSVKTRQTLRLNGIDTPEMNTAEGKTVKQKLSAMLPDSFTIATTKREKYGRYLAEIFVMGKSINQRLLDEGHAKVYAV